MKNIDIEIYYMTGREYNLENPRDVKFVKMKFNDHKSKESASYYYDYTRDKIYMQLEECKENEEAYYKWIREQQKRGNIFYGKCENKNIFALDYLGEIWPEEQKHSYFEGISALKEFLEDKDFVKEMENAFSDA